MNKDRTAIYRKRLMGSKILRTHLSVGVLTVLACYGMLFVLGPSHPTAEEMRELVSKELPLGVNKSRVVAFLISNHLAHTDFDEEMVEEVRERGWDSDFRKYIAEDKKERVKGIIRASTPRASVRTMPLCDWYVRLTFYFDQNNILIATGIDEHILAP
jgi:hypothetical protein